MNIKKAAASFLFMIFAMVCNVSMAFASWGGMGYKNCVLCGALVTPMPTYGGTQKYTEFYNCEEVEGPNIEHNSTICPEKYVRCQQRRWRYLHKLR